MTENVENRLAALEAANDQDTRLLVGIERLRGQTEGLAVILAQVRDQQVELARLEETKASKGDLQDAAETQRRTTLEFRKKTLSRIYTTGILMGLGLLLMAGLFLEYNTQVRMTAQSVCEARNAQNLVIIDILEDSIEEPSTNTESTREGIERFRALVVDCESL